MRKKEIQKLARIILAHERILQNPQASKEAKLVAEKEIQKVSNLIFEQEDPLDIIGQIDEIVLKELEK